MLERGGGEIKCCKSWLNKASRRLPNYRLIPLSHGKSNFVSSELFRPWHEHTTCAHHYITCAILIEPNPPRSSFSSSIMQGGSLIGRVYERCRYFFLLCSRIRCSTFRMDGCVPQTLATVQMELLAVPAANGETKNRARESDYTELAR